MAFLPQRIEKTRESLASQGLTGFLLRCGQCRKWSVLVTKWREDGMRKTTTTSRDGE